MRSRRDPVAVVPLLVGSILLGCGSKDESAEPRPGEPDAATGVCPGSGPEIHEGLRVEGARGLLTATLVTASPLPAERYRNDWTVEIGDSEGTPLADVELVPIEDDKPAVHAWMSEHQHLGVPEATFDSAGAPGRFDATLHLQMRGPWQIRFDARSASAGAERLVFDVCLPD